MIKTEKQKFLFRCSHCGAEFFFYVDEVDKIDGQDTTNDKKLWCLACTKRGTLIRVGRSPVVEKKFEYTPNDYREW